MKLIALKCRCNANSFKCQFLPDYLENAFMVALLTLRLLREGITFNLN